MLEQPWLLMHPEYTFKIAPTKNKKLSKHINFISSIHSSSESSKSSEELFMSSIICLTTFLSMYLHSFKKTSGWYFLSFLRAESKLITTKKV